MFNSRVMVPRSLQEEVLEGLHAAHKGVEGMQSRGMETVFIKKMEEAKARCRECNVKQPSQAALPPLVSPDYPFQYIVADYCMYTATFTSHDWYE